ncbi:MAG: ethanolamine utilization protein EutJ [Deltaproteobacteria bacterium]|jgi:ethanolamine utilization protein EutJ|nr:ethanolamine utilization protein EutJ [Deltaproteobacteria bacterium]
MEEPKTTLSQQSLREIDDRRAFLDALVACEHKISPIMPGDFIRVGLDLGTSSIVLVVLSEAASPLALARETANVVRDGLVVDFAKARTITERLRKSVESSLGVRLTRAAIAVPPKTSQRDAATHRYVCEGAGLEVDNIWEEPESANFFLKILSGAIADIGGGTTGAAVFKDGQVVASFDEATGGHHLSLVLAGHFKIAYEKAENFKLDPKNRSIITPVVAPVLSKMGSILREGLKGYDIPKLYLVGGSAAAPMAGPIISRETNLPVEVLYQPELITPVGIALGCPAYASDRLDLDLT